MSNLRTSQEPRDGARVVAQALRQIHNPAAGQSGLRSLDPSSVRYGVHHAVHDLDARTLADGGKLDQARRTGSRYLLSDASGPYAIEIATDAQGADAGAFRSLNQGPLVQGTAAAIKLAESQADNDPCEFSVLRIAALKLWLLWVKPDDPSRAPTFYVIHRAGGLRSDRAYTEDALLAALQPAAQELFKPRADAGTGRADLAG